MTTDAQRIVALQSLVKVLTSALKIVRQTHYADPPNPEYTPDKTKFVVESAIMCAKIGENI